MPTTWFYHVQNMDRPWPQYRRSMYKTWMGHVENMNDHGHTWMGHGQLINNVIECRLAMVGIGLVMMPMSNSGHDNDGMAWLINGHHVMISEFSDITNVSNICIIGQAQQVFDKDFSQ